jgi:hypothetical protein
MTLERMSVAAVKYPREKTRNGIIYPLYSNASGGIQNILWR